MESTGGTIMANGDGSAGIFVRSSSGNVAVDLFNDIIITYADGMQMTFANGATSVTGGSGAAAAIRTESVADTTATIMIGAGDTVAAGSDNGFAIQDGAGNATVTISGGATVTGKLDGGDGDDTISFNDGTYARTAASFTGWESLTLQGSAHLTLTDSLSLNTLTHSANTTLSLEDSIADDVLMVTGDYTGGGTLVLDADFATGIADRLRLTGRASGITAVAFNIVNHPTVVTPANSDGILVIDAKDATLMANTDFQLAPRSTVVNQVTYNITRGTEDNGNDVKDFYLRVECVACSNNNPSEMRSDPNQYPASRIYASAAAALQKFNDLSTYEERLSGRYADNNDSNDSWILISGDHTKLGFSSDTDIQNTTWGIQGGVDFTLGNNNGNQWTLGVYSQYGRLNTNTSGSGGNIGGLQSTIYGFGMTATWHNDQGTYFDGQLQFNWLDSDITVEGSKQADSIDAVTYAMGAEVGHRFKVGADTFLIPQAQISWGLIDSDSFIDDTGRVVNISGNDRIIARLGLAYELDFKGGQAYIIGNVLHDFSNAESAAIINNDYFTVQGEKTWGEIGVGGSVDLGTLSLSAELSYQSSFGGSNDVRGLDGTINVDFRW